MLNSKMRSNFSEKNSTGVLIETVNSNDKIKIIMMGMPRFLKAL